MFVRCLVELLVDTAVLLIRTTVVWLLWGLVMPGTFGLVAIDLGQAFGLVILVMALCWSWERA